MSTGETKPSAADEAKLREIAANAILLLTDKLDEAATALNLANDALQTAATRNGQLIQAVELLRIENDNLKRRIARLEN